MNGPEALPARVEQYLRAPTPTDHKYTRGTVSLVTGSETYPGAGVLSVGGASYGGAGMVRFAGSARAKDAVLKSFPETVFAAGHADALVIGCGWGKDLEQAVHTQLPRHRGPVVIDAGAIFEPWWRHLPNLKIITPHAGEAAALWRRLGEPGGTLSEDTAAAATQLAAATGCVTVLKGSVTAVASSRRHAVFHAPTAWPSVAGTGDVLAGVIGSVTARAERSAEGLDGVDAAFAAVWLHGQAAAIAAGALGEGPTNPIVASDIIRCLPKAWRLIPRS